jgi:hypothetical protein
MTGLRAPVRGDGFLVSALAAVFITAGLLVLTTQLGTFSFLRVGTASLLVAGGAWLFTTPHTGRALALLVLYLGLFDGYLKLRTNNDLATLGRDVLLYALAAGALLRATSRDEPLRWPPLSGLVIAFVAVCLVQVLNPGSSGYLRSIAALRPHLEFVPLFFLGFATLRTRRALSVLVLLLVIAGAANGVVSSVQFNLSPAELATWGPGYADRIEGIGVSGRIFVDQTGTERTRPFGLQADSGGGGVMGLLAAPGAVALLMLTGGLRRLALVPLAAGVALAIITSQSRGPLLAALVALAVFAILIVASGRAATYIGGLTAAAVVAYLAVGWVSTSAESGTFDRYRTVAPSRVVDTAYEYRASTLSLIPTYLTEFPLGAGLGSVGPATSFGQARRLDLNGESQWTFLIVELGVAGLAAMFLFACSILGRAFSRLRSLTLGPERLLLGALAAPLFAMFVLWSFATVTAGTPGGPYFWGVSGGLAYWLWPQWRDGPADPQTEAEH